VNILHVEFVFTCSLLGFRLLHLVVSTNHDCYVKLVVSGLDYSMDGMPRYVIWFLICIILT
jgi:hypothetical protein